jgi:hypothetical protein
MPAAFRDQYARARAGKLEINQRKSSPGGLPAAFDKTFKANQSPAAEIRAAEAGALG